MKHIFITLLLLISAQLAFSQDPLPRSLLPKAVFYKLDGKAFSTEQIAKDKKFLIMFYDATCEHCQRVAANLSKRSKELTGINLYMISLDEPQSIKYFMGTFGKPLLALKTVTLLQDKDMIFIPLFHPQQYPSLYLYGKDKRLIFFSSKEKEVGKFFPLLK
ncbi:MAG: redoxin domain-containing protein [Pedobacter sp.]